jgi:hypothetical protein
MYTISVYIIQHMHSNEHDLFLSGDWICQLFMHQACVLENKEQYKKANNILTSVIKEALKKWHIGKGLYEAIFQFQVHLNEKESYTSNRRSESLSLKNGLNICKCVCVCVCVCMSVPLQMTLGFSFIVMLVTSMLDYFGKFHYFVQPHKFPFYCAHNLFLPA